MFYGTAYDLFVLTFLFKQTLNLQLWWAFRGAIDYFLTLNDYSATYVLIWLKTIKKDFNQQCHVLK